jgi:uncharacterized protein
VTHRDGNGPFRSRAALKSVPRLGPKAFEQCAGFLRIPGAQDPLDASSVHPEAYPLARRIVAAAGTDVKSLIGNGTALRALKPTQFVDEHFGLPTVTDIFAELEKPGRDPRPAFTTASFADGVETLADLRPGMVLEGQVTNVAAFGAFVDIGVHQDGLVHVSAMSRSFVKDPREVVKSGDIVKVKVLDIDIPRKRVSLTLRLDDEAIPDRPGGGDRSRPAQPGQPRTPGGQGRAQSGDARGQGSQGRGQSGDGRGQTGQGRSQGSQPRSQGGQGRSGATQGRGQSPADTALADALRRAGLAPKP